jgi:hypothetical protein
MWGQIQLQGRPSKPHPSWVTALTVNVPGVGTFLPSTDQNGRFLLVLPSQTSLNITVKGVTTLGNIKNNVWLNPGRNDIHFGTLLAGDCNADNAIDITDFSIFRSQFGTTTAQSDFNGNGTVDIFDFSLLRTNFGRSGDVVISWDSRDE